ncbi:hypothetical protein BVY01_02840 [bacterium I07]|nr:hypothetical protein BVY01_02840 [bacterium I07]
MINETTVILSAVIIAAVVLYWYILKNASVRKWFLLILSMAIVCCIQPVGMLLCTALSITVYILCRQKSFSSARILTLLIPLGFLIFFKYLAPVAGALFDLPSIALPLGVSYYIFKQLHYVIESQRGSLGRHNAADFMLYIFYFPMFLAGPIERFPAFHENLAGSSSLKKLPWSQI